MMIGFDTRVAPNIVIAGNREKRCEPVSATDVTETAPREGKMKKTFPRV
ncbi:MAG: hypothetical protein F6K25_16980 [Okeania sp. SIO2G4]|nr:hypothetical protein [Okeania sp. SIO2H7]NEQ92300.1 hypothetical protein [Okeania sp. SIO2G4]